MSSAVDYTTVNAGQDIYPDCTFTDSDDNVVDPATVQFALRVGDSTESAIFTYADGDIERVSQGVYRLRLDTTDYGDSWLWGEWTSTVPKTASDWQAYVVSRAA